MGAMVQGSLRGPISALALQSITDFHLDGREDQLAAIQRTLASLYSIQTPETMLNAQAGSVMRTIDLLSRLNATEYQPANDAWYPESDFGMGMKQTAQLIKAGVGLEVACVDIGGWDTHENQGGADGEMAAHLEEFASGLAAFYSDMGDEMRNVTVVTMSEFGRTASENGSAGTDHGRASVMFVIGGGASGQVYARWNGLRDDALDEGDLPVTTDYRDVLAEIVAGRILNPALDSIFPGYTPNQPGLIAVRS
jgi:uncharacterized protein (DUF1501 family)